MRRPKCSRPALLVALLSNLFAAALATPQAQPPLPTEPPRVIDLPASTGDARLVVPVACAARACPLLVVSHRRNGGPSNGLGDGPFASFLRRFSEAGYAVLLSSDGGPSTWGNNEALLSLRQSYGQALQAFRHDGRTFALGLSMGGLTATLAALRRTIPALGVVVIDGTLSLETSYQGLDASRRREIEAAYGLKPGDDFGAATAGHDVVRDLGGLLAQGPVPMLVFASRDDQVVPFEAHAGALAGLEVLRDSLRVVETRGAHLGGSHLGPEVAAACLAFMEGLAPADPARQG